MLHGIFNEGYSGTFWEHILKEKRLKYLNIKYLSLFLVPRPGVEPGWVAPLVFETSASTDSAIWALIFRLRVQR